MTANLCVRCERPMPDTAYACTGCGKRAIRDLLGDERRDDRPGLADTAAPARDIAQGQSRNGDDAGAGRPGSRLPLDLGATARLDGVQTVLVGWVRHIASERGRLGPMEPGEPITICAYWLAGNMEWMRHRPEAGECFEDIETAARIVRGIARGPAAQKFLGLCGAPCEPWTDATGLERTDCPGVVYGRPEGDAGRCRICGHAVSRAEREKELHEQVRDKAFQAAHIAEAYGINVKTIRGWATEHRAPNGTVIREARLKSYYRVGEGEQAHVVPWTEPAQGENVKARGPRLFYLGDVLDLAEEAEARRAQNEARRERAAAREAAEMRA